MDNTLISGLVSSIATLIGAIIGATATIVAAFISKSFADRQIRYTTASEEIKPLARLIIRLLSLVRVTGASVFIVKKHKAFIDGETGITLTVQSIYSVTNIDFEYQLPGQTKSQRIKSAPLGWKVLLNYMDGLYALTLVDVQVFPEYARFDFRKINNVIIEVEDKQVTS